MRDCDCVPGHRCDCWEYRSPADGLRETLERHVVATATSRGVQFKLSHSEYHVPAPAVRDWLRAALAAQVPVEEERLTGYLPGMTHGTGGNLIPVPAQEERLAPQGWEWQCASCHRPVAPMGMCETCGVFGIMRAAEYRALGDEPKEEGA